MLSDRFPIGELILAAGDQPLPPRESGLDTVLRLVRDREGLDLRAYRRQTVERRVTSRFQKLHCQDYGEYATLLDRDPDESRRLVDHVTIKVSRFFRDAHTFSLLRDMVLPELVHRRAGQELRLWSAGCGNGEEAYSLAILLAEMARVDLRWPPATILGTDVDENALAAARQGVYGEPALREAPPAVADGYFTPQSGRLGPQYEVLPSVRAAVQFRRHDLLSLVPAGPGFDLVLCRNVLIYFERPAQEGVLQLLTSSVVPGGYLCLGEAEQLSSEYRNGFETVDRPARLYRKVHPARPEGGQDAVA